MLYIVGTPIGNLEDLSYRQAKTISEVEILLTEDTRSTGILLQRIEELFHFPRNPSQRMISYYKEKEFEKLPEILELLQEDKTIALISQAGSPLIADPGYLLITHVIKQNLPFTVIPGPTAASTALIHSGFNPAYSFFIGFLPKKKQELTKLFKTLLELKQIMPKIVIIAYESPERIQETLEVASQMMNKSQFVIARELTKKYEEISRGTAAKLKERPYKGELVLLIQ